MMHINANVNGDANHIFFKIKCSVPIATVSYVCQISSSSSSFNAKEELSVVLRISTFG
jgi:hypothetical protein